MKCEITIAVQTEYRLTKNGMKNTHNRTIKTLTRKHREIGRKLAHAKKMDAGLTKPLTDAEIYVTSYWARSTMDYDGLACTIGPTIDGFVDAGIIKDDSPRVIRGYHMDFEKVATMAEVRVEVRVTGKR